MICVVSAKLSNLLADIHLGAGIDGAGAIVKQQHGRLAINPRAKANRCR